MISLSKIKLNNLYRGQEQSQFAQNKNTAIDEAKDGDNLDFELVNMRNDSSAATSSQSMIQPDEYIKAAKANMPFFNRNKTFKLSH